MNQKSLAFLTTYILKTVHNVCIYYRTTYSYANHTFFSMQSGSDFVITKPDSLIFTKSGGKKSGSVSWEKIYLKTHT